MRRALLRHDAEQYEQMNKSLTSANQHLLDSGKYSDVKFLVGASKVEVKAHKLMLMKRSKVFAAMVDNDQWTESKSGIIELPEVNEGVFRVFLQFIYTDTFKATIVMEVLGC